MRPNRNITLSFAILAIVLARSVRADDAGAGAGGSITTSGHATFKRAPDIMRMRVLLHADGKGAQEAIDNLAQRRKQVKEQLLALGAIERTLDLGVPGSSGERLTPQQRQMQMVMAMQRRQHPTTQPQQGVSVSCTLQAEWPISAQSADEGFVRATDLQTKITAALHEGAAKKAQTPEEQEIAEEMSAAASSDPSDTTAGNKPNEPNYVFVHKLGDDELSTLATEAMSSARAEAKRLANASGITVGRVLRITTTPGGSADENPYTAYLQSFTGETKPAANGAEATGTDPGQVTWSMQISATFAAQ